MPRSRCSLRSLSLGKHVYQLPTALGCVRNGVLPHLGPETAAHINKELPLLLPLNAVAPNVDVLKEFGKGWSTMAGLATHPTLLTSCDPSVPIKPGYNGNKDISVWAAGNRIHIDPSKFMSAVSSAKPCVFVALSDGDTPPDATNKRVSKAVANTIDFLDICLRIKNDEQPEEFANMSIWGSVQGGYSLKARRYSAEQTAQRDVDGFLLDGFHGHGAGSVASMDLAAATPLLKEVLQRLPEGKPRMFAGSCDPLRVIELIELGVDVFDTSYVTHCSEAGKALNMPISFAELSSGNTENGEEKQKMNGDDRFCLDLSSPSFKDDFSPLVPGCTCYTCTNHSRAYVNHLLATNELLAPVLLMLHNMQRYLDFFEAIRDAMEKDGDEGLEKYKKALLK